MKNKISLYKLGRGGKTPDEINYTEEPQIYIKDNRTVRKTTGKKINPNRDLKTGYYNQSSIDSLVENATRNGINPYRMLAQGMVETGLGNTGEGNIGHVLHKNGNREENYSEYDDMVKAIQHSDSTATRLNKKTEEEKIQAFNGYGKLTPSTEKGYHGGKSRAFYGVNIPKQGLDMNKNPLYGKEVLDIQKNIMEKDKNIETEIKKYQYPRTQDMPKTFKTFYKLGGKIPIKFPDTNIKKDNTNVKPFEKDLRPIDKKKTDLEDYKKSQRLGEGLRNIAAQTALDQVGIKRIKGLKNTPYVTNVGTKVNATKDVYDTFENYNDPMLGGFSASLNLLKPAAPIVGDAAINAIQEGIQYYDEQNPTKLSKIKHLPQEVQDKIVNKPFGYNHSFKYGGSVLSESSKGIPNKPLPLPPNKNLFKYGLAGTTQSNFNKMGGMNMVNSVANPLMGMIDSSDNEQYLSDGEQNVQGVLNAGADAAIASGNPYAVGAGLLTKGGIKAYNYFDIGGSGAEGRRKEQQQKINFQNTKNIYGKGDSAIAMNNVNTSNSYGQGGMKVINNDHFNPSEEVEGGESAVTPNGQNIQFNGPKHTQGGIKTNLPEGTRIFSDQIYYPIRLKK